MRRKILTAAVALLCFAPAAHAHPRQQQQQQQTPQTQTTARTQATAADAEKEAVRRVVETYLYSEEVDERRSACAPEAKLFSYDHRAERLKEVRLSSDGHGRGKTQRSRQQVVGIDVAGDGATVKVETDLSPGRPEAGYAKHVQFISLLKFRTGWKIVSILMPPVLLSAPAEK